MSNYASDPYGPSVSSYSSDPYTASVKGFGSKKKGGGGFWGDVARYSGAELVGNLASDVGETALGIFPGIVHTGAALGSDIKRAAQHPLRESSIYQAIVGGKAPQSTTQREVINPLIQQYGAYYGHDIIHHLYKHPLQPLLDIATVATVGAGAGTKLGLLPSGRAVIVTRSPRVAATGKGPVAKEVTSDKPLVRGRATFGAKIRTAEGVKIPGTPLRVGGEMKAYGKQIQSRAGQKAMGRLTPVDLYGRVTKRLSADEWRAMHIRAMDIHPSDLVTLWRGTPNEGDLTPRAITLALEPSKRMLKAEPVARAFSESGAELLKGHGKLGEETAAARPDLTKRQASEVLGRPVKEITGDPYYFPHTLEPQKTVSPLATGGGKGVPRVPGTTKQNLGVLALRGKLHLRGDVLGPEFLRRVKYVKYDEIHNALVRGAIEVTPDQIAEWPGGKLPQGWEFIREKASTKVPATLRGEGETHMSIESLIPDVEDLRGSPLAEGFSTIDPAKAHTTRGSYHIAPRSTIKAATGEYTRSNDFVHFFVKQPLKVWRAVVLGLRVGFLTNNLVGNSIMYGVKTGGQGALRDLFGAIVETHGRKAAKEILDSPDTPPHVRADLYKEFFPEQVRGTFGLTQSPATSTVGRAVSAPMEVARTVTGAIPKLTSKVAEEYPRRALVRHYIRHSPEFKRVYQEMPKQARSFEAAARMILEGRGGTQFQRVVSQQVDHALGNYLHLSPVERNVIRNTLPFYTWYRAIVSTTFHLAVDTPIRANILSQVGQIGKEWSDEMLGEVPHFLAGAIGLGQGKGGTKRVLSTQGLNPYATLPQLGSGATDDLTSLGINPFPIALLQTYANEATRQRTPFPRVAPARLFTDALKGIAVNLPPSRLVSPLPPSKLYPNRDRTSTFWQYLGAPIKDVNPVVAAQQKAQGR